MLAERWLESGNSQSPGSSWQSAVLAAVPSGWFYLEKLNYSRTFQDYLLPAIDVPGRSRQSRRLPPGRGAPRGAEQHSLAGAGAAAPVLLAACCSRPCRGAVQKTALAQTGADCAALACALERFRLARGQFPESLDALVPKFISQLPHDVINGQPLKYRRTADGQYLLYSVGWNQTDDGGVLGLTQSGQASTRQTGDWVWRLPGGAWQRALQLTKTGVSSRLLPV